MVYVYCLPNYPRVTEFGVLGWWKANTAKYPHLSKMARDILMIPVSTVASESSFSTGGRVLDEEHSSMIPETLEALVCGQDWVEAESAGSSSSQGRVSDESKVKGNALPTSGD